MEETWNLNLFPYGRLSEYSTFSRLLWGFFYTLQLFLNKIQSYLSYCLSFGEIRNVRSEVCAMTGFVCCQCLNKHAKHFTVLDQEKVRLHQRKTAFRVLHKGQQVLWWAKHAKHIFALLCSLLPAVEIRVGQLNYINRPTAKIQYVIMFNALVLISTISVYITKLPKLH